MFQFILRRAAFSLPTLFAISGIIFALIAFTPGDPLAQLPLNIPADVRDRIRESLGLNEPFHVRFFLWLRQIVIVEPLHAFDTFFGTGFAEGQARMLSFQTRTPVFDVIAERLPQTLWVVGVAYLLGCTIAIPIGLLSARYQHSLFDQIGSFISLIGFSVPPFLSALALIAVFSVTLGWLPTVYDTTHNVTDFKSFLIQVRQMALPVCVLVVQTTAQVSRFTRSSVLDNLHLDYVKTARAKGLPEHRVMIRHVLRNSLIPVVTVIALGAPTIFGGAIITEQIFKVNGIGQLLVGSVQANDVPMVQTLTFIFAALIVLFNLIADILYGLLDPRIRYD